MRLGYTIIFYYLVMYLRKKIEVYLKLKDGINNISFFGQIITGTALGMENYLCTLLHLKLYIGQLK